MYQSQPCLVKIIHSEFNVFQIVTPEDKVFRLYEQKNGRPIGIKDMNSKVIHPFTEPFYKDLYISVRQNTIIN